MGILANTVRQLQTDYSYTSTNEYNQLVSKYNDTIDHKAKIIFEELSEDSQSHHYRLRTLIVMSIVLSVIICIFIATSCSKQTDPIDYVNVEFSGYETEGTASITIDDWQLINDVYGVNKNDVTLTDVIAEPDKYQNIEHVRKSITANADKNSGLSNGDKIVVTVTVDNSDGLIKQSSSKTFTVSGLTQPTAITKDDLVDIFGIEFEGISGEGVGHIYDTYGELSKSEDLSNGDIIQIIMSEESKRDLLRSKGIIVEDNSFDIEVTGLTQYPKTVQEIANLDEVLSAIDKLYQDDNENTSKSTYAINDELIAYRDLPPKGTEYYQELLLDDLVGEYGVLIMVCSIHHEYKWSDGSIDKMDYFMGYGYSGIIVGPDGLVDLSECETFNGWGWGHTGSIPYFSSNLTINDLKQDLENNGFSIVKNT